MNGIGEEVLGDGERGDFKGGGFFSWCCIFQLVLKIYLILIDIF